jgi:hypothetical protein
MGTAPISVGRSSYYVSFIDDFSKFSWIYLLKCKSKVFERFMILRILWRGCLIEKSLLSKLIGEANIKNSTRSFSELGFHTMFPALMRISKMARLSANIGTL